MGETRSLYSPRVFSIKNVEAVKSTMVIAFDTIWILIFLGLKTCIILLNIIKNADATNIAGNTKELKNPESTKFKYIGIYTEKEITVKNEININKTLKNLLLLILTPFKL